MKEYTFIVEEKICPEKGSRWNLRMHWPTPATGLATHEEEVVQSSRGFHATNISSSLGRSQATKAPCLDRLTCHSRFRLQTVRSMATVISSNERLSHCSSVRNPHHRGHVFVPFNSDGVWCPHTSTFFFGNRRPRQARTKHRIPWRLFWRWGRNFCWLKRAILGL